MFFANDNREKVREENPGISFGKTHPSPASCACKDSFRLIVCAGQVGKMLGEKWKSLSDSERRPYEEKAAADKKRYEEEKEKYNVCPAVCPLMLKHITRAMLTPTHSRLPRPRKMKNRPRLSHQFL